MKLIRILALRMDFLGLLSKEASISVELFLKKVWTSRTLAFLHAITTVLY